MIFSLTLHDASIFINDLLKIDQGTIGEKWAAENFLFPMEMKWELSHRAETGKKSTGFLIASKKENMAHIHRVAVDREFQGTGVGKEMIDELEQKAKKFLLDGITLKVATENKNAIDFYTHIGFKLQNLEGHNFLMMKNF